MYKFSSFSKARLSTCHPELQTLCTRALIDYDISVLSGMRTIEQQKQLVSQGLSQNINSKHLKQKDGYSHAVDVALYPIDWKNKYRFVFLAGFMDALNIQLIDQGKMTYRIRCGVDFKNNREFTGFFDGPHIELIIPGWDYSLMIHN